MTTHKINIFDDRIEVTLNPTLKDKIKIMICVLFELKMTLQRPRVIYSQKTSNKSGDER